jgi:hypothetical protein
MAQTLFHILPRTPGGGLSAFAKEQLRSAQIKLSFQKDPSEAIGHEAAAVLTAFQKLMPKSVMLSATSPFLILGATTKKSARLVHPLKCACQCGIASTCGGGGGGTAN